MKTGKWICLMLAIMLACAGILAPVKAEIEVEALERLVSDAVADENARLAGETAEIAAIEIADLDAPRDGAAFDTAATIIGTRADGAEDVSWQTPVIWTDREGNLANTARAGQTYMPFITLFVPESCALVSDDVRAQANITLPAFFAEATGQNDTLYFLEAPASGLVFITGEITVPGARATAAVAESAKRTGATADEAVAEAQVKPSATLEPELMVHTNARTVEAYGADYMRWLIETVKNVVEPRAVNMLIDAFPVYREALKRGELSSGIGFFVEKQQNTIAYVKCASLVYKGSGNLAGKALRVVVNADFFADWDAEKGEYVFNESRRSDLEFTITHEILHATMYDLIPTGMLGVDESGAKVPENKFPAWFTEGTATAVDNAFRYRRNELLYLCLDIDRYEEDRTASVSFTPERMIVNYRRMSERYSIDGGASSAEYAYTSGYLASLYLMQLASEHLHDARHVAGRDSYASGDMREGFNYILEALHDGKSLDQIIATISPTDGDGRPIYQSIADYQARFLGENDRDYSASFCANFLKYLESLGQEGKHSWGCILIDFDDMRETLFTDGDAPVEALAYRIEDTGGYVNSDVPIKDTLTAGGATLSGQEETQIAAKLESEDDWVPDIPDGIIAADGEGAPEATDGFIDETPAEDADAVAELPDEDAGEALPEDETPIEEAPLTEDETPINEETSIDADAPAYGDEPSYEDEEPAREEEEPWDEEPAYGEEDPWEEEPTYEEEEPWEEEPIYEEEEPWEEEPSYEEEEPWEEEPAYEDEVSREDDPAYEDAFNGDEAPGANESAPEEGTGAEKEDPSDGVTGAERPPVEAPTKPEALAKDEPQSVSP